MTVQFRLPDLGEGVAESEIIRWLVQPGDEVVEDQPMVEVMTDKATVEIPAPAGGLITAVHAQEGDVVPVGTVIIEIRSSGAGDTTAVAAGGAASAGTADTPAPTNKVIVNGTPATTPTIRDGGVKRDTRVQATPLVRKLATQLGVDPATIVGSGPNGRVTEHDVRTAAGATGVPAGAGSTPAASTTAAQVVPLRGVRRAIAEHLTQAQRVPTVTVVEEADLTLLEEVRASSGLGYLPYLVQAVIAGFAEVPELNATLDEKLQELHLHEDVNLGIAVQTDAGLLVPVLRDCAGLSLVEIEERIVDLAELARDGQLTPEQTRGGTFTLTSAGKFGGLFTTPLLNVPEVGILGLHRISERPVVVDGEVVVRRVAHLSISFDHRALDGIAASRFLLSVIDRLQAPSSV